ncbi:hypothetical protein [Geminisphaera colitermitum]|uniref:hypothetical protein n=1 Tax=Geminisphaera colitermitum TaxID=1148786 RepID=UPI000158D47C|nr:hypothetical protein [Geminisphaera colitermitum]
MKFMNDWVALALAFGLVCGGCVIGRRIGSFAAIWLAGAAWLALRMADAIWEPATRELGRMAANLEAAEALPAAYGLLFAGTLLPTVLLLLVLRPTGNVELPARIEPGAAIFAGMVAGVLVLAAVLQSHIQVPDVHEAMPRTMVWTKSALDAMGQTHTAPPPATEGGSP